MSIDLEQFHGIFFEESLEHIDTMELLLMNLDVDHPDPEQINSIFRAAHSIKGGSGTFGFTALTGVTHVMENLFDQVRNDERPISRPLVNFFLSVLDTLRALIDSYRANEDIDQPEVDRVTRELETVLNEPLAVDSQATANAEPEDEDFGLFSALDSESTVADGSDQTEEDAFGFFDPLPETALPESAQHQNVIPLKKSPSKTGRHAVPAEPSTIRVDTEKVDALINLVGELVITQSMLKLLGSDPDQEDPIKMAMVLEELESNTREIQKSVMSIRMIPVSFVFKRFPRVVRDLAAKMEKEVDLVLQGTQTELDKGLIEKLVDPLTHLVRNSIDHGIEKPELRRSRGKPARGKITISATQQGGSILISVSDDGAGLSRQDILEKAHNKGLSVSDDAPDSEVWDLIFQPGFSTANLVTDVSGRGVGMDVVRRNIQQIGGRVEISSTASVGSTFTIQLPLTLAIVDGMGVSVDGQIFIVPLSSIVESMQPLAANVKHIGGSTLLHVRDEYWPILPLCDVMDIKPRFPDPANGIVVLIETTKRRYGLQVDELVGQQQVVIKSLEQHYRRVPGTAGATIMGDGSVALILDVESLADIIPVSVEESA